MKARIQKMSKKDNWKESQCVEGLLMDPNNSLSDAHVHLFFFECSAMLNATPVTSAFLSCTLLMICFFSDDVLRKHVSRLFFYNY